MSLSKVRDSHRPLFWALYLHLVVEGQEAVVRAVFPCPVFKLIYDISPHNGYVFFGPLLRWCPSSQHAYAVVPEGRFKVNADTPQGSLGSWNTINKWTSHHKQRRDLFYLTSTGIRYAGTFYVFVALSNMNAGSLNLDEVSISHVLPRFHGVYNGYYSKATIQHLAETSVKGKKPEGKARARLCIPIVARRYAQGLTTVDVIGLQRVGFNGALLEYLKDPTKTVTHAQTAAAVRMTLAPHQRVPEPHTERHESSDKINVER